MSNWSIWWCSYLFVIMPLRRKLKPAPVVASSATTAECAHEVQLNSMCVSCGAHVKKGEDDKGTGNELTMAGGGQLMLSKEAAERQQEEKVASLRSSRKLALVLDLDHTLIHTMGLEGPPQDLVKLAENDVHYMTLEERLPPPHQSKTAIKHFLVKKRPMLDQFLHDNSETYQLSIYTAGTRKYAEAIAKLIDPSGKLFGGRIVSRSDVANDTKMGLEKSLRRLFLGDASMAVIVDDREDVWQGEQGDQLLLVRPFAHFKGGAEVNNTAGITSSSDTLIALVEEQLHLGTVTDVDDQLLRVSHVLQGLYSSFYTSSSTSTDTISGSSSSKVEVSTATLLSARKRGILSGCVVSFSGLIPQNEPNPAKKCALWRLALSLGAQVTYVFCYTIFCSSYFLSLFVTSVSLSLSITACLHSLTPHGTSLTIIPYSHQINQSSIDTLLTRLITILPQVRIMFYVLPSLHVS
jgi:FCP1-like phosphatase family protein